MNNNFDDVIEIDKIKTLLAESVHKPGFSSVVVGCSGGIDSTTSLYLAEKALGKDAIIPLLLPYKDVHSTHIQDAKEALSTIGIEEKQMRIIDIAPSVDHIAQALGIDVHSRDPRYTLRLGNIMARTRMIALFDMAKASDALVLGTENKSEHFLGYYTRFGDEASDIEPLRHLYKTEVYRIAKKLNVPDSILKKAPTAALWPGQTDEKELGFTYEDADKILYKSIDQHKTAEEIIAEGMSKELVSKVLDRVNSVSFKHTLPLTIEE